MKVCVVCYQRMAFHSISFLCYCLQENNVELDFVGDRVTEVQTIEGITMAVKPLSGLDEVERYSGVILPGGDIIHLLNISWLERGLAAFDREGKFIGSICAATRVVAELGFLRGRQYTSPMDFSVLPQAAGSKNIKTVVVQDGNLLTARGQGFTEFALSALKMLACTDEEELGRLHRRYRPSSKRIRWDLIKYDRIQES